MVKSSYSTCLLVSEENDEAITVDPDEQVKIFILLAFQNFIHKKLIHKLFIYTFFGLTYLKKLIE